MLLIVVGDSPDVHHGYGGIAGVDLHAWAERLVRDRDRINAIDGAFGFSVAVEFVPCRLHLGPFHGSNQVLFGIPLRVDNNIVPVQAWMETHGSIAGLDL